MVFFSSLCTALRAWLFASASERVVARLRKDLFSHLINQVRSISSRTCKTRTLPVRKKYTELQMTYRNLHNVYPFLNHCTVGLLGFISISSCWKHIQTVNNFYSVRAVLGTLEVNNYQVTLIILLALLWNSKYHLVRLMLHGSIGNSILWCYSNGGTTKQAIWRHTDHKECSHYQSFWGTPKSNNCIYWRWLHVLIFMEINM